MAQQIIVTGRTRTLKYSGEIASTQSSEWVCNPGTPPDGEYPERVSHQGWHLAIGALGADLYAEGFSDGGAISIDCTPSPANYGVQLRARIIGLFSFDGGDVMDTGLITYSAGVYYRPGSISFACEGEYEFTLPVEEVVVIDDLGSLDPTLVDSDGFPYQPILDEFGNVVGYGSASKDGTIAKIFAAYERAVVGEYLTATITVNGNTETAYCLIVPQNQFYVSKLFGDVVPDYGLRAVPYAAALGTTNTLSVSAFFQETIPLSAPWTVSKFDASASTVSGMNVFADATTLFPLGSYSEAEVALFPQIQYRVRSTIGAMHGSLASTYYGRIIKNGDLATQKFTMGGNTSFTMNRYGCAADLNGTAGAGAFADEWGYVRAFMDEDEMLNNGDDTRDFRLQILGKRFDAFEIEHHDYKEIADGTNAGAISSPGNTVSSVGGAIRVVVA